MNEIKMSADKAYLLGLVIGGGKFGNAEDVFTIKLPYQQWGSYKESPQRASEISRDILKVVSPMFKAVYNLNISFEASDKIWYILCEGDTSELRDDLESVGIESYGELRGAIDLKPLILTLVDDNLKRRFVAGLADTIGSISPSHRRFSDEMQIISFEIKGFNFDFVCDLCKLFYTLRCYSDQILWNHPNFHAANDPYYNSWKKGFKLRVNLEQYDQYGAFAFSTKAKSTKENLDLQDESHEAQPCVERGVRATPSCVHPDEHAPFLPECIRGGHYLHNKHVCAVMKCEHAPYDEVSELLRVAGSLINPFPILHRDVIKSIEQKIQDSPIMSNRTYTIHEIAVSDLMKKYRNNSHLLLFGNSNVTGYEQSVVLKGVAYILASSEELHGKRIKGNYIELIEEHLNKDGNVEVIFRVPELLTPLIITGNGKGVLVGAKNPKVYQSLIEIQTDNPYKVVVRPIEEKDLMCDEEEE